MKILLNLSGHPAPKGAEEAFDRVISVPVPNLDLGSEIAVAEASRALVISALDEDGYATLALFRGEAAILLPGSNVLAGAVLATLVGIMGTFPHLYWAVRAEEGFILSEEGIDLGHLRMAGRAMRP